jgi:hypothetical protein
MVSQVSDQEIVDDELGTVSDHGGELNIVATVAQDFHECCLQILSSTCSLFILVEESESFSLTDIVIFHRVIFASLGY